MAYAIESVKEIQQYRAIGTVKGYENAINAYTETYILMKEYKSKLKEFEKIGTIEEFKALKEKERADKAMNNSTWGANKEISVNWQ